jgi:NADH pyrophosphatase NudC (nudix superfamily)
MSDQSDEDRFSVALAMLREAWLRVLAQVLVTRSPRRQWNQATALEEELRKMISQAAERRAMSAARLQDAGLSLSEIGDVLGITKQRASALIKKGRNVITALAEARADEEEDTVTESATKPEPQPVVAAIVTNGMGVLIGRRNDGKPPWTFIAGEIEPGESPEDAGVREVKEETGLLVRATGVLGRRVHPKTRRTMIYMSAEPTHGTRVFVGDEDELAEVRWATLAEADELLPGMFEPVREHLAQKIGN